MSDQNILDKSMRSVFVGNIPYEATEEKLKDIFNEVGPVISFKLVYDRETGKPKGYGFCEYKDQETALSAMRNLNCYEIGGRTLRVDNACTEKSRLEMQSLMLGMPTSESYYGDAVNAEKAPEIINNIVSTLSPEQLYELMKQMKDCVQNNPAEARNMFLQNPQLGYAILQAQVVMKIVEPEKAKNMLYPAHKVPPVVPAPSSRAPNQSMPVSQIPINNTHWNNTNSQMIKTNSQSDWQLMNSGSLSNQGPLSQKLSMPNEQSQLQYPGYQRAPLMDIDSRTFGDCRPNNNFMPIPPTMKVQPSPMLHDSPQVAQPVHPQTQPSSSHADAERAALILQVLQLTDAQIAMLPAEQRLSIMQLKEKIALSSQKKE